MAQGSSAPWILLAVALVGFFGCAACALFGVGFFYLDASNEPSRPVAAPVAREDGQVAVRPEASGPPEGPPLVHRQAIPDDLEGIVRSFEIEAPGRVAPDRRFRLRWTLELAAGWHVYPVGVEQEGAMATRIEFSDGRFLVDGPVVDPPGRVVDFEFLGRLLILEGRVVFEMPLAAGRLATPAGRQTIEGRIVGQACDDSVCVPLELPFVLTIDVDP